MPLAKIIERKSSEREEVELLRREVEQLRSGRDDRIKEMEERDVRENELKPRLAKIEEAIISQSLAVCQDDSKLVFNTPIRLSLFVHNTGASPNPLSLEVVIIASLSSATTKWFKDS